MTGNVLKRLREAYGLSAEQVADIAAMPVPALKSIERAGSGYAKTLAYNGKILMGKIDHKQRNFRRVLDAMRALRKGG